MQQAQILFTLHASSFKPIYFQFFSPELPLFLFLFLKQGFSVLPWLYCMQTSLSSNWGDPLVSASQMLVLKLCITNTRLEKCYSLTMKQLQIPVLACRTVAPVITGQPLPLQGQTLWLFSLRSTQYTQEVWLVNDSTRLVIFLSTWQLSQIVVSVAVSGHAHPFPTFLHPQYHCTYCPLSYLSPTYCRNPPLLIWIYPFTCSPEPSLGYLKLKSISKPNTQKSAHRGWKIAQWVRASEAQAEASEF